MSGKKQLDLSARSIKNMAAIKKHIEQDNPAAAKQVISSLLILANQLTDNPMMGHSGHRAGTRELVMTKYSYTLVYRITASKVRIVAVYHQRQIIQGDQ